MTTALFDPILLVILPVGHDLQNEHLVGNEEYARDEPVFVATNVEYGAISNDVGSVEIRSDLSPIRPLSKLDVAMPGSQGPFRFRQAGQLPEFPESRFGDNPHSTGILRELSAASKMILRTMRIGKLGFAECEIAVDFHFGAA
jgi:hypothetical protein